jgi:rubredoxin
VRELTARDDVVSGCLGASSHLGRGLRPSANSRHELHAFPLVCSVATDGSRYEPIGKGYGRSVPPPVTPTQAPVRLLVRGLTRRCPNCGGRKVFRGWFTLKERCPTCGLTFERDEGFFLGAFVVNFGLVLLLLFFYVLVGVIATLPDPPVVALSIVGILGCAAVAIFFYPMSKTFWLAIDLIMKPAGPEDVRRGREG